MTHQSQLLIFDDNNMFNKKVVELKNSCKIIRVVLHNNPDNYKYMLIKDCIPMSDRDGNMPYYALSGADIIYQYNYGTFYPHQELYLDVLSEDDIKFIYNKFHFPAPVVFGEKVKHIKPYNSIDDINKIVNNKERKFLTKLFNDIKTYNWKPIKNDFI